MIAINTWLEYTTYLQLKKVTNMLIMLRVVFLTRLQILKMADIIFHKLFVDTDGDLTLQRVRI